MAQVKIYGNKKTIITFKNEISTAIHGAVMSALAYPPEKKFHRFIELEKSCFIYPSDRTENYIIIEIAMFEGRSIEAKKELIRAIYKNIELSAGILANDIEIALTETPKYNWGIRGKPGDELALNYKVEV